MAELVADHLADHDVTRVVASSLERAQETAAPIADAHGLPITTDDRVIEAGNYFEGKTFGVGDGLAAPPAALAAAGQPVPPVVGRALRGDRGADAGGDRRRPRRAPAATRP